ncbi:hypothetical protein PMIN04_013108, partial [Paraphaeosphaeria minitans]
TGGSSIVELTTESSNLISSQCTTAERLKKQARRQLAGPPATTPHIPNTITLTTAAVS